jgi:tetratricopeptide (TPR) repeat protein
MIIADHLEGIDIVPGYVIDAYNERASIYFKKRAYDRAIADCTQMLLIDSTNIDGYLNRGVSYSRKGDFIRAIDDFKMALKLEPNNSYAKRHLDYAQRRNSQ